MTPSLETRSAFAMPTREDYRIGQALTWSLFNGLLGAAPIGQ